MPQTDSGPSLGTALLGIARAAIASALERRSIPVATHPALANTGATFVTLTQRGELRGCIGTLEAHRSLREDVEHNALAAAFRDPRFPPLTPAESHITRVEVSLLSVPAAFPVASEAELIAKLSPGIDGIVFAWRGHRATFLPQVWDVLPEPRDFLAQLKRKAGLPPDFWDVGVHVARYTVEKFREPLPEDAVIGR